MSPRRRLPAPEYSRYAGPLPYAGPADRETRASKMRRLAVLAANIRIMLAEYAALRGALFPDDAAVDDSDIPLVGGDSV